MNRQATAVWKGGLKDGQGTLNAPSKALQNVPYSFVTRFENQPGTNPEELIAAAHAGCFSMALSGNLVEAGFKPESIETVATVTLDKTDAGPTVTKIHLDVVANVPGIDPGVFDKAAQKTKSTCPISRLLKTAEITMAARLGAGART